MKEKELKSQSDVSKEMSDMAQLGELVLSYPEELITDLFIDFLQKTVK